jgi:hypothetical protein
VSGYCFALGCDRSGTTALIRLLTAHDAIVMGMERYKYILTDADSSEFGPALFETDRFLDFREGDTNITPSVERFRKHYAIAEERLVTGDVRWIGDKVMARPRIAQMIHERFPSPRYIFIYRDLLRVASSFVVRARNPKDTKWPESVSHETALDRWNQAFDVADLLIQDAGADNIFCVRYERLFDGELNTCDALFGFLELDVTPEVAHQFTKATAHWDEHEAKPVELTELQRDYLLERLDHAKLARFDALFNEQLARYATA